MVYCRWHIVPPAPAETVKIGNSSSSNPKAQLRGIVQQALQAVPPAFLEASAGHPKGSPEAIAAQAGVEAFTVSDTGAHSNTRPVLLSGKMQLLVQELLSRKVRGVLVPGQACIWRCPCDCGAHVHCKSFVQELQSRKFRGCWRHGCVMSGDAAVQNRCWAGYAAEH